VDLQQVAPRSSITYPYNRLLLSTYINFYQVRSFL